MNNFNKKEISIKCEAKEYFDIEDLIPFQGKLKSISKENFDKLKRSLIKDGLPLGFHIWKNKGSAFIMDGHHRQLALKSLRDSGYFIPPVPCVSVIAKAKKDAAKAVLISNSKYAEMNENSISDFMIEHELSVQELSDLDIPDLNMDDFKIDADNEKTNHDIIEDKTDINFGDTCPHCGEAI